MNTCPGKSVEIKAHRRCYKKKITSVQLPARFLKKLKRSKGRRVPKFMLPMSHRR